MFDVVQEGYVGALEFFLKRFVLYNNYPLLLLLLSLQQSNQ